LEKRSDCGKIRHANGRPTIRTYPAILEFVQSPLHRDRFAAVFSKEGVATGFYHADATLILSDSCDEYTGESKSEFLDLNWKAVGGREGNITGKRLKTPEKPPGV
jgi:hypothetical protein